MLAVAMRSSNGGLRGFLQHHAVVHALAGS
jgi:hypothetical protein